MTKKNIEDLDLYAILEIQITATESEVNRGSIYILSTIEFLSF